MSNNLKFYKVKTKPSSGITNGNVYFVKDEGKIYVYNNGGEDYTITADKLKGFSNRRSALNGGVLKNQNFITGLETSNGGGLAFTDSNSVLNCQIDGAFYQNEGNYKVLDENSIRTTSIPEANLTGGEKNHYGSYGCIDAAMIPTLGANRLAYFHPDRVIVEYSRDGGSTGTDYGLSDDYKSLLFVKTGKTLCIGKSDSTNKATGDCQLRITIKCRVDNDGHRNLYTTLNKFAMLVSTSYSNGSGCSISVSKNNSLDTFTDIATKIPVSGGSGWNVINTAHTLVGGYTNNTTHNNYLRFTFGCTGVASTVTTGLQIHKIFGFGGVGWETPSNMAAYGVIYMPNANQAIEFPSSVYVNTDYINTGLSVTNKKYVDDAIKNGVVSGVTWEEYS